MCGEGKRLNSLAGVLLEAAARRCDCRQDVAQLRQACVSGELGGEVNDLALRGCRVCLDYAACECAVCNSVDGRCGEQLGGGVSTEGGVEVGYQLAAGGVTLGHVGGAKDGANSVAVKGGDVAIEGLEQLKGVVLGVGLGGGDSATGDGSGESGGDSGGTDTHGEVESFHGDMRVVFKTNIDTTVTQVKIVTIACCATPAGRLECRDGSVE